MTKALMANQKNMITKKETQYSPLAFPVLLEEHALAVTRFLKTKYIIYNIIEF
jgi:hypothetical protein